MADESYSSWIGDLAFAASAGVSSGILMLAFGVLGSFLHHLLLCFASSLKITVHTDVTTFKHLGHSSPQG
jgi:hypothetical protein